MCRTRKAMRHRHRSVQLVEFETTDVGPATRLATNVPRQTTIVKRTSVTSPVARDVPEVGRGEGDHRAARLGQPRRTPRTVAPYETRRPAGLGDVVAGVFVPEQRRGREGVREYAVARADRRGRVETLGTASVRGSTMWLTMRSRLATCATPSRTWRSRRGQRDARFVTVEDERVAHRDRQGPPVLRRARRHRAEFHDTRRRARRHRR